MPPPDPTDPDALGSPGSPDQGTTDPVTTDGSASDLLATIDVTDRTVDVTDRTVDVTDGSLTIDLTGDPDGAGRSDAEGSADRQRALGARLRRIRGQQGLSLAQVEERSEGRWKAVVVGAYERGDRAVTIERLASLAAFYDVPIAHLLPSSVAVPVDERDDGFLLDLTRLGVHDDRTDALGAIARFARRIQLQRGDHAGRVITLRDTDVRTIALAAGIEPAELRQELRAVGVATT